jgi:hypothetical protein
MADERDSEANNNGGDELKMEVKGDGFMFHLRDGAFLLIKMQAPTIAMVQMWQGTDFVGPDSGNIFAVYFRQRLAKSAKERFGSEAPNIAADIERVAQALGAPQTSGKTLLEELREAHQRSTMDRLIIYSRSAATFFHNKEQEAFASIRRDDHLETYELDSPRFKLWMRSEYWRREKERLEDAALEEAGALYEGDRPLRTEMPEVVRDSDLGDAVRQLESIAIFEGRQQEVHVRCAQHEQKFYLDLGDQDWRAVEISREGWQIVPGEDVPVRFVRPKGTDAFVEPLPSGKGSLEPITRVLNLGEGEDGKRNRLLLLAWLTYSMLPNGPYPIINISGPQGAAKTTTLRALRFLIDPNTAPKGTKPKNEHDTYIDAAANWVVAYDQLVSIPVWFSNVLCDLATGGGYRTRTLYSNRDQEIFDDTRPIIVSGIGNVASRPDFLDRALMITLPRIGGKQRKKESVVKRQLRAAQPEILSALLDATAQGLATVDSVVLESLPRMADFCVWGCAVEPALGAKQGDFLKAFQGSSEDATEVSLEEWALADTFISFAAKHQGVENAWVGTATQLYNELNSLVGDDALKRSRQWPGSPNVLSSQINDHIEPLLKVGVVVKQGTGRNRRKKTIYTRK